MEITAESTAEFSAETVAMAAIANISLLESLVGEQAPEEVLFNDATILGIHWNSATADLPASIDISLEGVQRSLATGNESQRVRATFRFSGITNFNVLSLGNQTREGIDFLIEEKSAAGEPDITWAVGDMDEEILTFYAGSAEVLSAEAAG